VGAALGDRAVGTAATAPGISPSETVKSREEKIADYRTAGVRECWIVSAEVQTVDVLRLSPQAAELIASYRRDERVQSGVFPGLSVGVAALFAE
jgi:Uma2 family endonuclease